MPQTRRDFIKFVVAGSVAADCPVDLALVTAPAAKRPKVDGEHNEICHQVRDGHHFDRPPVSKHYDVAIVGGGVSGLSAAYFLKDRDFLILEKETHWGGNAYLEEYDGQAYATGAAFIERSEDPAVNLAREIGLELLPVQNPDPTLVGGVFIEDTWGAGLDHLPYAGDVRESFKKFRRDMQAFPFASRHRELDDEPFSKYFAGYEPEVKNWWDNFGPSNWGARTEETSALLGIGTARAIADESKRDDRVTWPGGLGAITQRLADLLKPGHGDRMLAGATTVAVEQQKNQVSVTYLHDGELRTVAAKAVIMATPKFITWRLVAGMPAAQSEAMKQIRYIPYPVVNVIFDRPVFNSGYDTWCPGNTFTDFIVADWVVRKQPGYKQRHNILTFYTPLGITDRVRLLTEEECRDVAASVLRDFQKLRPEFNVDPVEIHLYRRGHALYMSTPGNFTRVQPIARRSMERIAFANTDSEGPESTTSKGIEAARRAVREVEVMLAAKSVS